MPSHASVEQATHDPALAAARVVESAVELARAEARLLSAHARAMIAKTIGAFLACLLAISAAQVALLLAALLPALLPSSPRSTVLIALLPSLCLSALGSWLAIVAWRGLRLGAGGRHETRQ